jgi:uncharacterized protein YraI
MDLRSLATTIFCIGLLALPASGLAYTNYTTAAVNQRTGPGVGHGTLGALPAGTPVEVSGCRPGWCRASSDLGVGWISSKYLSGGQRSVRAAYPAGRDPYATPRVYPYYSSGYSYRPYLDAPRAMPNYPYSYGYGGPGISLFFSF